MKNKKTKQLSIAELLSGASKPGAPRQSLRASNMKATKTGFAKKQQLQIRKSGKK